MSKDVFISYSHLDIDKANLIKDILELNKISCWMDKYCIPAGANYPVEIQKGIRESKVFVLLLSTNAQESRHIGSELDIAFNEGKLLISFGLDDSRINESFDYYLRQAERLEAYLSFQEALKRMIFSIKEYFGEKIDEENEEIILIDKTNLQKQVNEDIQKQIDEINKNPEDNKKKIAYASGAVYTGDIKHNKANGRGKIIYENGDIYEGECLDNKKNGFGKMTFANGEIYEGEWKNDFKEGHGKQIYENGESYEGEWKNGRKNGYGKYIYDDGSMYEGEWKWSERSGHGKITNREGVILYEGEWKFDQEAEIKPEEIKKKEEYIERTKEEQSKIDKEAVDECVRNMEKQKLSYKIKKRFPYTKKARFFMILMTVIAIVLEFFIEKRTSLEIVEGITMALDMILLLFTFTTTGKHPERKNAITLISLILAFVAFMLIRPVLVIALAIVSVIIAILS